MGDFRKISEAVDRYVSGSLGDLRKARKQYENKEIDQEKFELIMKSLDIEIKLLNAAVRAKIKLWDLAVQLSTNPLAARSTRRQRAEGNQCELQN